MKFYVVIHGVFLTELRTCWEIIPLEYNFEYKFKSLRVPSFDFYDKGALYIIPSIITKFKGNFKLITAFTTTIQFVESLSNWNRNKTWSKYKAFN